MGKKAKKKKTTYKRMKLNKKRFRLYLIIVIIIIIFIAIKTGNKVKTKDNLSIVIDNQDYTNRLKDEIIIQDEMIYLSFNDIKETIDENIYLENDKMVVTASNKKVAAIELDNREIEINGSRVSIDGSAFKTENNTIYLPISELKNVYDIELSYNKEAKNIVIDYYSKKLVKAYTSKKIKIKEEANNNSDTIEKIKKEEWLIVISDENGWTKVRTQNGNIGYTKSKYLKEYKTEREDMKDEEKVQNEKYLEKSISKKEIKKYEERKNTINEILLEIINKQYKMVKAKYKGSNDDEEWIRFKNDSRPILKECGIEIIFE